MPWNGIAGPARRIGVSDSRAQKKALIENPYVE